MLKKPTKKEQIYLNQSLLISEDEKTIISLIENGADISTHHYQILITASVKGKYDLVKYLLEHGADVHAQDDSALVCAIIIGNFEIVKLLVTYGADIHVDKDICIINGVRGGKLSIIRYLIENGAEFKKYEKMLLTFCDTIQKVDVLEYLVKEHNLNIDFVIEAENINSDVKDWAFKYKQMTKLENELHIELISNNKNSIRQKL